MDKLDKKIIIDDYITMISGEFRDIETILSFLRIDSKDAIMLEEGIKLFKKKFKKIKKSKSIKDINKYIDIKKILKEYKNTSYTRD